MHTLLQFPGCAIPAHIIEVTLIHAREKETHRNIGRKVNDFYGVTEPVSKWHTRAINMET